MNDQNLEVSAKEVSRRTERNRSQEISQPSSEKEEAEIPASNVLPERHLSGTFQMFVGRKDWVLFICHLQESLGN